MPVFDADPVLLETPEARRPGAVQWHPDALDALDDCAVIQLNSAGHVERWNAGAADLLGHAAQGALHRHLAELVMPGPEGLATLTNQLERARLTGSSRETCWLSPRHGGRTWMKLTTTALARTESEAPSFLVVAREVATGEARERLFFDATPDATLVVDRNGIIVDANAMTERLSGRPRAELRGSNLTKFVLEGSAPAHPTLGEEPALGATEVTCQRSDATTFPAEVNIAMTALGSESLRVLTLRDVSLQKRAQAERDRLLRLVEAATDFVGVSDPHGNIIYQNAAANRVMGLADDADVTGLHVSHMHPAWASARILEHALPAALRDGSYTHETVLLGRGGEEIPVSQLITVHRDARGEVEFLSTIMRDLRSHRQAEALLAKVASQVHGMLYQLEMAASGEIKFTYVSRGCIELYGVTPEDLNEDPGRLGKLLVPEDAARVGASLFESAKTMQPWVTEYRVRAGKDQIRWHRGQAVPERAAEGIVRWHGFVSDITDAKWNSEELQRRKTELEDAIAAMDAGFAMYDASERLVICNDRYAEMYSVPAALRAARPTYAELVRASVDQSPHLFGWLPAGTNFETWLEARLENFRNPKVEPLQQHGERWIRAEDHKTSKGGTVCIRTDVTAIKRAEFEAQLQQGRLKLATSAAGIGIWELDVISGNLTWDARMLELHECKPEEFQGTYLAWRARIHPDDLTQVEVKLQNAIIHGEDFRAAFRVVRRDGSVRHLESRSGCVRGSGGDILRVLGVTTDITEHIELQETLQRTADAAQAASKVKAEFLATMSHEIRTPMNGVIGMTNLLIGTELDGTQREYVETIRASGESLLTLINDILDFSKLEAGKLMMENVPFSLEQAVMESITLFTSQAEAKGVRLIYELPSKPSGVVGDPTRFRQVLLNLVSNALKFTKVGSVKVQVQLEPLTPTTATVELRVSDTGIGMTPEHLARVGEAFLQADASTTRQFGGTGLGLSICRSLVQLMNGTLTVTSEFDQGTAFTVRLPLDLSQSPGSVEKVELIGALDIRLQRVLVAEDNAVNQRVVGLMLKKLVDQVDFAGDGREALALFMSHSYDCILMDGQMPEMDGLEATRQIRAFEAREGRPRTPIIALTANALPGDRETFLAAGMDEYLTKPIRSGDLAVTLSKVRSKT